METLVHGSLKDEGLEVVRRDERLFLRCDAGAHTVEWREDEISEDEFQRIAAGGTSCTRVLLEIQRRLIANGIDAYRSNWSPA
jgi:hypothetical protein